MRGITGRGSYRNRNSKNFELNVISVIKNLDIAKEQRGRGPKLGTERQILGVLSGERGKGMVKENGKTFTRTNRECN